MQCKNGGWASFDKDNTKMVFQYIPFADHNAMLDPPTVDITGRVLEMLATYGYTAKDKRVERAVKFIYSEQEPDGSWFGRWGVNYIYGTFLVLRGLEAIGVDHNEPQIQQAAEWIRSIQNADGGWGESCDSYDDPITRGDWAKHAFANGLGIARLAGSGRYTQRLSCQGCSLAAGEAGRSMDRGTKAPAPVRPSRQSLRAPASPGCFTLRTTCTGITSRCWR